MKLKFTLCLLIILIGLRGRNQIVVSVGTRMAATYVSFINTGGLLEAIIGTADIGANEFANVINDCTTPTWTGNINTDWNVAGNWCKGLVPDVTTAVMIPIVSSGRYPLISNADAVAASVTINNEASLTMSGAYNLTLSTGAAFNNNGTFTGSASTGAIIFAGTGTVSGTVGFNNVTINGAVDFGTTSTVNGNLTINSGGAAGGTYGTNLIKYGAASTLIYNTTLSTGNEWYTGGSGTIIPGAGIPQNVTILSGTITIPNSGGYNRALAGNLIINSGSNLKMTAGTSRDIYIAGNWTNNGGIFTANGRKVTFNAVGTSLLPITQTLSGTTTFYDLTFGNSFVTTDFGSSVINILDNIRNDAGSMNGNTSSINFTGTSGLILGISSKYFNNLSINSGNNVADNVTSTGDIHIYNSFTNNGTFSQLSTHTTYFDKSGAAETMSGTGSTVFGNFTIGGAALSFPTTLNTGSSNFTISGAVLSFNSKSSALTSSTGTVTFALGTAGTCTVKNASGVTGTSASFFNVVVNPPLGGTATALDFGSNISTVNSSLTINNNGSVITNAPAYGNAASLTYNTTTPAYVTGLEWSVNSTTPGAGVPKNVTIQNTNNVLLGGDRGIGGKLTIASTDSLKLNDHTLTLNGSISNTGFLSGSSLSGLIIGGNAGAVYFSAGGKSNVLQTLIVKSSASATLGNALNIVAGSSSGTLTADGTLNANGNLTLLSDANGTAMVGKSAGTINGNVTVQRYFSAKRAWRYLSVPTNTNQSVKQAWQENQSASVVGITGYGTQVTDSVSTWAAKGFDYYSPFGPSVKKYIPALNKFLGIASTSELIATDEGYMTFVRGDRTAIGYYATPTTTILRTTGALFMGTRSFAVPGAGLFKGIGNPYAAPLDMRNITVPAGIDNTFYLWDPNRRGSSNLGGFVAFISDNNSGYIQSPQIYPLGYSYIQSGQAFFMHASSGGTLTLTEDSKASTATASGTLVSRPGRSAESAAMLRTNLYTIDADSSASLVDGTLQMFGDFSNAVDQYDAIKLKNLYENLAIRVDTQSLAIERRHAIQMQDTIHFILLKMSAKPYTLELIGQNFDPSISAILEDSYTNTHTPLNINGTTTYKFIVADIRGSWNPARFRIVFKLSEGAPLSLTFNTVKAFQLNNIIAVAWTVENEKNIRRYEIERSADAQHFDYADSITVKTNDGGSVSYQWLDVNAFAGNNYYRIKSIDINGDIQYSNKVKIITKKPKSQIVVFPNPIVNDLINFQLINQPAGSYGVRLLNKLGQVIKVEQVQHPQGISKNELQINIKTLAHGVYQLEVTKPDQSKTNIKVVY